MINCALRLARDFESDCRQLTQINGGDYRSAMATAAEHWGALRPIAGQLPSIDQQLLGSIDGHLGELGGPSYSLAGGGLTSTFSPQSLASLAATVEGGTESIRRDIDQIDRRIRSASYLNQLDQAARESSRHAERLHDELTERRPDRDDIDREVRELAQNWQTLGRLLNELPQQAGNDRSVQRILGQRQQLEPAVAQLITGLIE